MSDLGDKILQMRELWVIEINISENRNNKWEPDIDLVYETGEECAREGARSVEGANPGLRARAVLYVPLDSDDARRELKIAKQNRDEAEQEMSDLRVERHQAHAKGRAEGIVEALTMYAWWRDGVQYVGTCGTTLEKAVKRALEDM